MTERSNSRGTSRTRGPRAQGKGRARRGSSPKPTISPADELHPVDEPPDIESFEHWDLAEGVQEAIAEMGITSPTPIQRLAIGEVLKNRDVIAKAETGTGKTLAFGAPMMSMVEPGRSTVLGLVLCPTRELAQQVAEVLKVLGEKRGLNVVLIVGGDPMQPQIKALQQGAQVVVGTPGRVLDLLNQRFLTLPWTEFVVLDEADEMLEIGFLPDVEKILDRAPEERKLLLFSATFPPALLKLARKHSTDAAEIATAKGVATVDRIEQSVVFLESEEGRQNLLGDLIARSSDDDLMLCFCDRRTDVDRLMRRLERLPMGVKALHGGYDQAARFRVMSAFREGGVRALIATDVASRGLDVSGVTHVINFGVPRDVSTYTHRIGRTGRAGATGKAVTFVQPADRRKWKEVAATMNWDVEEVDAYDLFGRFIDDDGPRGRGRSRDRDRGGRDDRDGRERPRRERSRSAESEDERPEQGGTRRERPDRERDERPRRERSARRNEGDDEPRRERPTRSRVIDARRPKKRDPKDEVRNLREEEGRPAPEFDSRERPERSPRRERDERPRRDAREDRAPRTDRDAERPRRRRRSSAPRSEDEGRERPTRGERDVDSDRPQREERPRREMAPSYEKAQSREESRSRDENPSREERPRRSRSRRNGSSSDSSSGEPQRNEQPRRSRNRAATPASSGDGEGGFGAGLAPEPVRPSRREPQRSDSGSEPKSRRPRREPSTGREPNTSREPSTDREQSSSKSDGGAHDGFGAGL